MFSRHLNKCLMLTVLLVASMSLVGCPSKEVIVIDDLPNFSLDKMWDDFVSFFKGGDSTPFEVGDIIVGSEGGGFLRRVLGINDSGGSIGVDTEFVTLAEAIEDGVLSGEVQFTPEDFAKAGAPLVKANDIAIDLGGTVLYNKDGLSVTIVNGTLSYAPEITLDAVFADHKLQSLKTYSSGPMSVNMDVKVQATKPVTLAYETTLWTISKPFVFYIGPVPVAGTASLSFPFGVSGTITGTASVTTGFDASAIVTLGGELSGGKWVDKTDLGQWDPNGHPPVFAFSANAGAIIYVKGVAGLNLYGCSDLTGTVKPYVQADAWLYPAPQTLLVTAGIDGAISYKLGIFDFNLVDETWYFPGPKWELYKGSWN